MKSWYVDDLLVVVLSHLKPEPREILEIYERCINESKY